MKWNLDRYGTLICPYCDSDNVWAGFLDETAATLEHPGAGQGYECLDCGGWVIFYSNNTVHFNPSEENS